MKQRPKGEIERFQSGRVAENRLSRVDDDAVLEMETTKNRFVIYRDSFTENVNVIYRREDGKFALLEINS